MRCHDCGKEFTSWDAFKTHLRTHASEEESRRRRVKRARKAKSRRDAKVPVPEKKPEASSLETVAKQRSGSSDVDKLENEEEALGSPRQTRALQMMKTRPVITNEEGNVQSVFPGPRKSYPCSICGKVYSYLESFKNHQTLHEQESLRNPDHKCPYCEKFFVSPSLLLAHLKEHKPTKQADEPVPKCGLCKKEFASQRSWLVHLERHKTKPYWCLSCSKGFKDEDSLNQHLQNHKIKHHKCDQCSKIFGVAAELRHHYNTQHTGKEPYRCVICKKSFFQLDNLIAHREKHIAGHYGSDKKLLGSNIMNSKRRVSKLTKLIFSDMSKSPDEGEEEEERSGHVASDVQLEEEATTRGFEKSNVVGDPKEWECYECSMSFDFEHELHQHYMDHARGEVPV